MQLRYRLGQFYSSHYRTAACISYCTNCKQAESKLQANLKPTEFVFRHHNNIRWKKRRRKKPSWKTSRHCSGLLLLVDKKKALLEQNELWYIVTHLAGCQPTSWLSGNEFVSEAEGLRFKLWAGQIGHSVENGSPSLRHFFVRNCAARRRND